MLCCYEMVVEVIGLLTDGEEKLACYMSVFWVGWVKGELGEVGLVR